MPTVREITYDLLRTWGLTTVFGNPGSNELPFLDGFPADFRYVLGPHEGAVLAMADGYAQAAGRPALVITAGQQARAMVGPGSVPAEPAMTRVPEPHVKWAFEPPGPSSWWSRWAPPSSATTPTGQVPGCRRPPT